MTDRNAIEKLLRGNVIVYGDGTPRTKHVTTNLAIEIDECRRSGIAFVLHRPTSATGPRSTADRQGRYFDRFERRDGHWCFVERRVRTDLVGDVSRHLHPLSTDQ
ncbi:MAG: nuclear transport factor 2 family protein [Solirubrobacteraceae bacterium]